MSEYRMEPRKQGYAKIIIDSRSGYLRNFTDKGCKIVMMSVLPYERGEKLPIQIIPHETSGLDRTAIEGELRWKRKDGAYFLYGFHIVNFASDADAASYHRLITQYGRS